MNSLLTKLAALLLALFAGLGALALSLALWTSRLYSDEAQQRLNRGLAATVVGEKLLMRQGETRPAELKEVFTMMMVVNPDIEAYLLDPEGVVLAYSAPPGRVVRERVRLAPIEAFLSGARLPITGDDPRDADGEKIFSAAPIRHDGRLEGYLYIVLSSELQASALESLRGSYVLKLAAAIGVGSLGLALLGAFVIFSHLTRRLRRLDREMTALVGGDGSAAEADGPPGGDEIDRLTASFRSMARRIEAQLEALEAKDRMRRELVANISHDLRTPLTHLQGYLETLMLKPEASEEERRGFLEIAVEQSARLGRLVEDLFELAKLETLDGPPRREAFSAAELVSDIAQKLKLAAMKRGIALEVDSDGLAMVEGDLSLIERVLENLLDNALRHTPDGGRIAVRVHSGDHGVEVEVRDTGVGIPAAELPHIFERFYRVSAADGPRQGSGLGLAIAKRALALHASDLVCTSEVGRGTTFRFALSAPDATSAGSSSAAP